VRAQEGDKSRDQIWRRQPGLGSSDHLSGHSRSRVMPAAKGIETNVLRHL
jgi:hypothetical protein